MQMFMLQTLFFWLMAIVAVEILDVHRQPIRDGEDPILF